jgi:hypothetical protein
MIHSRQNLHFVFKLPFYIQIFIEAIIIFIIRNEIIRLYKLIMETIFIQQTKSVKQHIPSHHNKLPYFHSNTALPVQIVNNQTF